MGTPVWVEDRQKGFWVFSGSLTLVR